LVETLGTSVADKGSFLSRVLYKVLEIMGAAVATAVSGYLMAHLGGFLPSHTQAPTPPAMAVAPSERPVAKSSPANVTAKEPAKSSPANVPANEPAAMAQPSESAAAPASVEAPDRRLSQTPPEAAVPPAPKSAASKTAAKPSRKNAKPETAVAPEPNRPRETAEAKPREAPDAKPRPAEDKESVEAQVKAALANVDANRAPLATQSRPTDIAPNTTAAIPPRPSESPQVATGSQGQPRSADLGSPLQQPVGPPVASQAPAVQATPALQVVPVQPPPQQPDALTSVEIKSRPIATIDTLAAPQAAPPQEEEKGVASFFKRILPDLRRPASIDDAPRPPASVGE
jgi:hypothetical protein